MKNFDKLLIHESNIELINEYELINKRLFGESNPLLSDTFDLGVEISNEKRKRKRIKFIVIKARNRS
jgi:hypothetical protein